MNFLDFIPASIFEIIGILAGLSACIVLTIQIFKEYKSPVQSSLSSVFVIGWIFIYLFWGLYGIRFHTIALWVTNGIAFLLQISLYIIVLNKRKKYDT